MIGTFNPMELGTDHFLSTDRLKLATNCLATHDTLTACVDAAAAYLFVHSTLTEQPLAKAASSLRFATPGQDRAAQFGPSCQ